jgi:hypothetical protein
MTLLRSFFWFSIFLGATFVFSVLFEYGPSNFSTNAQVRFEEVKGYALAAAGKGPEKKADKG